MKLLLDENLPHQLRHELRGHDVITAAFMGWSGIENGELLTVAAANAFDAIITNDRGIEHEQNLQSLPLAVVVLMARANTLEAIRPLVPNLLAQLQILLPKTLVKVST
jgi:predicted nuclease of predicted toxin-antitoxin system